MIRTTQFLLGFISYLFVVLPYVRRVKGRFPRQRRIYVCNHTSLLDTVVIGGLFWSHRRLPVLVLGDKSTWRESFLRRLLSSRVGYLIDRGKPAKSRLKELQEFGRRVEKFNLLVFPEGTRGDGTDVGECHPGIYTIAKAARVPLVPVFIENMAAVSTKESRFRPLRGLRRITVHVGEEFALGKESRAEFLASLRERIRSVPRT